MSLGGLSGIGGGNTSPQGNGANASSGQGAGSEFSLEKQQTGASGALVPRSDVAKALKSRTSQIVDRKKRNRKGAPRTVLVDGEIYEVFLLAIA